MYLMACLYTSRLAVPSRFTLMQLRSYHSMWPRSSVAVVEHDDHRRVVGHLLDVVEGLGARVFRRDLAPAVLLARAARLRRSGLGTGLRGRFVENRSFISAKIRPNEFSVDHGLEISLAATSRDHRKLVATKD